MSTMTGIVLFVEMSGTHLAEVAADISWQHLSRSLGIFLSQSDNGASAPSYEQPAC